MLTNPHEEKRNHSDLLYSRLTHRHAGFFLFTTKTKLQPATGTARIALGLDHDQDTAAQHQDTGERGFHPD